MIFGDFSMDFATFFKLKMQQKICFFWNLAGYWTIQSETDQIKLGTDCKKPYRVILHLVSKNFIFLLINQTIFVLKLTWRETFFQYAIATDLFTHHSQLSQCLTSTNVVIYIVHFQFTLRYNFSDKFWMFLLKVVLAVTYS